MSAHLITRRGLIALGVAQCVNWGVLYYAFAVLVVPIQRELRVETWVVTGAFSLALLTSAAAAPTIGRWCDRGLSPVVMHTGGLIAAGLLFAWALLPGVALLYAVWALLGLCMSATLYEPAFAIIGRAYPEQAARLRALAAITLFGGLASTTFLPATAFLVEAVGWRGTAMVLATALALSATVARAVVFRSLPAHGPVERSLSNPERVGSQGFMLVAALFTLATLVSGALVTNLVPALGERGVTPTTAALLGGLMGIMQLPGRLLLMNGIFTGSPASLLALSLALHTSGLALVAFGISVPLVAAGTAVFALGAGLTALARPHIVHSMFGVEASGTLNGRIARQQQLARAAGPILVAWLASRFSYSAVLAVCAASLAAGAVAALGALGETRGSAKHERA